MTNDRRLPPHSLTAEESLLGAVLLSREAIRHAAEEGVEVGDFYKPAHQFIYNAVRMLVALDVGVDVVTVMDELRRAGLLAEVGGSEYLLGLQNATPAISNARRYAAVVRATAQLRNMIAAAAEISDLGYSEPHDVASALAEARSRIDSIIEGAGGSLLDGFYPDIGMLDTGDDRDEAQPWIGEGVLRRGQRLLVVAKAGVGKSMLLRQLAFCAVNGVHPWTGQPTYRQRRALIVELEAGAWDITTSMRVLLQAIKRATDAVSLFDLQRPALLHREGGIDVRSPAGLATLEAAIQRVQPELVVIGPVKYLSLMKPGENYETAALQLMALLNALIHKYRFAIALEAHFSRGDHGAPGGSERWVDWPDVGFSLHPPDDDMNQRLPAATPMTVKTFRIPRDSKIWVPSEIVRGAADRLPWSVDDARDPYYANRFVYETRYGSQPINEQQQF